MIGLEGSGFTIAIGVVLLLTGVVMYYCRHKIVQCEHKMESMFSLVSTMHEELEAVKKNQQVLINNQGSQNVNVNNFDSETTSFSGNSHPYQDLIPVDITNDTNINDSSESESDSDSNTDSEYEEETGVENVKVVDLGLIEELQLPDMETEALNEDEEENQEVQANTVEVINLAEGEEDNGDDADDDESDSLTESEENTEEVKQVEVTPMEAAEMDYTRMQVSALKKLVSERNLTTGVAKLRKHELINILQAS